MPYVHIVLALPDGEVMNHQVDPQKSTPQELCHLLTHVLLPAMGSPNVRSFTLSVDGVKMPPSSTSPLASFGVSENSVIFVVPDVEAPVPQQQQQQQISRAAPVANPQSLGALPARSVSNAIAPASQATVVGLAPNPAGLSGSSVGPSAEGAGYGFDLFDPEVQRRIAEDIKKRNVNENVNMALEHAPEMFGSVNLAFIDCEVNGHKFRALLDTGAQTTFMHRSLITLCNLERIFDDSVTGVVMGVGTSRVLGKVHAAQIKLGDNLFLMCSFLVCESLPKHSGSQSSDPSGPSAADTPQTKKSDENNFDDVKTPAIFGIDMLRRHQAVIDFKNNTLMIQNQIIHLK